MLGVAGTVESELLRAHTGVQRAGAWQGGAIHCAASMDFSWAQALPFGILMFLGTLIGMTRRRAGRAMAQRGFPGLAAKLGLQFEAPRYEGWAGRLKGSFRGHEVLVQSDDRARIVVFLSNEPQIELRSYEHFKRVPEGLAVFTLGDRKLHRWLPNRFCLPDAEEQLSSSRALQQSLAELSHRTQHLKQLTVESQRIEAVLEYGSPPFIPTGDAERLLTLLTDLATEVEACFQRALGSGRRGPTSGQMSAEGAPDSLA